MPRQRSNELELNFDGLTDSVTNLVGALILLVVLVIGVTKEAVSQQDQARQPKPPGKKNAGEKSVRPLQDRVNQLKAQIDGVDKQADQIKAELKRISTQVDNLLDKVRKVQTPKAKPATPKKEVVKLVSFRPPFKSLSFKQTNITFVCDDKRVGVFDLAEWKAEREAAIRAGTLREGRVFTLKNGDFDVKLERFAWANTQQKQLRSYSAKLVRKQGHPGETIDSLKDSNSRFVQTLKRLNPAKDVLQFSVYPNSYESYRAARKIAWELKYDLDWIPLLAGEPLGLGFGNVTKQ